MYLFTLFIDMSIIRGYIKLEREILDVLQYLIFYLGDVTMLKILFFISILIIITFLL